MDSPTKIYRENLKKQGPTRFRGPSVADDPDDPKIGEIPAYARKTKPVTPFGMCPQCKQKMGSTDTIYLDLYRRRVHFACMHQFILENEPLTKKELKKLEAAESGWDDED